MYVSQCWKPTWCDIGWAVYILVGCIFGSVIFILCFSGPSTF